MIMYFAGFKSCFFFDVYQHYIWFVFQYYCSCCWHEEMSIPDEYMMSLRWTDSKRHDYNIIYTCYVFKRKHYLITLSKYALRSDLPIFFLNSRHMWIIHDKAWMETCWVHEIVNKLCSEEAIFPACRWEVGVQVEGKTHGNREGRGRTRCVNFNVAEKQLKKSGVSAQCPAAKIKTIPPVS